MNNTAIRLYAVAAIVVATYAITRFVQFETKPPETDIPNWTFRQLPLRLGNWHGEETTLDPEIAAATGADVIVDRLYLDEAGRTVSMHSAMFHNPADGVYHSPLNCYRANGWKKLGEERENVQVAEDLVIPVSLTTWEKEGERIIVLYWFQLGEYVLYDRLDLGGIRWAMRGQPKWPVLTKVMVQITVAEPEDSKTLVLAFTEHVAKWLNQPEHRTYLDRWKRT